MPIESTTERAIRRLGEQVTVKNYEEYTLGTVQDEYGDVDPQLTGGSPFTGVPALAEPAGSLDSERGRAFTNLEYDMRFIFPENNFAAQRLHGREKDEPPSEIERAPGDTYRVERVLFDRDGGIVAAAQVTTTP